MARRNVPAGRTTPSARAGLARPMPRKASQTAPVAFRAIPAEGRHMLTVAAGVECETARREAADLEDAVRHFLANSIETGMPGSAAFLCEFALEAACALRTATR